MDIEVILNKHSSELTREESNELKGFFYDTVLPFLQDEKNFLEVYKNKNLVWWGGADTAAYLYLRWQHEGGKSDYTVFQKWLGNFIDESKKQEKQKTAERIHGNYFIQSLFDEIEQGKITKAIAKRTITEKYGEGFFDSHYPEGITQIDCFDLIDTLPDTTTLATSYAPERNHIIFLSHCSSDKKYADIIEKFMIGIGLKDEQLIYTSHPLHGIPLDKNINDFLRNNLNDTIKVVFLWSNEFLKSPACLNEVGAVWFAKIDYTHMFVPNFDFTDPKFQSCSIDTKRKGIILNDKCKSDMIEFKNKIISFFNLSIDDKRLTYLLDNFMRELMDIETQEAT
jgi:hypothetical protein